MDNNVWDLSSITDVASDIVTSAQDAMNYLDSAGAVIADKVKDAVAAAAAACGTDASMDEETQNQLIEALTARIASFLSQHSGNTSKSTESFAGRYSKLAETVSRLCKECYTSDAMMTEDCEGEVVALDSATKAVGRDIANLREALKAFQSVIGHRVNEDNMSVVAILADAIQQVADDADKESDSEITAENPTNMEPTSLGKEVNKLYGNDGDSSDSPSSEETEGSPEAEQPSTSDTGDNGGGER